MDSSLVSLITELVMTELARTESAPLPVPVPDESGGRKLLVCPGPAADGSDWSALRGVTDVRWVGVAWAGAAEECLRAGLGPARIVPTPKRWDELVTGVGAVVLPGLTLDSLARCSLLLSDLPPVAAALAAIMQGVPVLATCPEATTVTRHAARLPVGFLKVAQQTLRAVEGMGLQVLEPGALAASLRQETPARPGRVASKGRDVLTMEDLQAAQRSGLKVVRVAPGTIVTPLAQDGARQMGIEVSFE